VIKGDSLSYNLGMKFSTKDKDNDEYWGNCAKKGRGNWCCCYSFNQSINQSIKNL